MGRQLGRSSATIYGTGGPGLITQHFSVHVCRPRERLGRSNLKQSLDSGKEVPSFLSAFPTSEMAFPSDQGAALASSKIEMVPTPILL